MASKEDLQKLIKRIRAATGLTQEKVSIGAGYKKRTLTQILSGEADKTATYNQLLLVYGERLKDSTQPKRGDKSGDAKPAVSGKYKKGSDYWLDKYVEALERDKDRLFDSIHSNLIQVVAQAESLKFDVVSARRVLLDNVSLLRELPEDALRNEADNIKKALIDAEIESGKKIGKRI